LLRRAILILLFFGSIAAAHGQMKRFYDPATDVSFSYPAAWQLDNSLGDYMPTEILGGSGPSTAIAKVGFHGIPHTNLTNVEFVYAMTVTNNAESCYAFARTEEEGTSDWVELGGRKLFHYAGSDAGLSHSADENIYAFYRVHERQCLLFEEDVDSVAENVEDWAKPVPAAKLRLVNVQMAAVMKSVVIGKFPEAFQRYDDPKEPVSFIFPSSWTTSIRVPQPDFAVRYAGRTFNPSVTVGFLPGQPDGKRYAGTDFGGLDLTYTVIPGIGFEECYPLARKLAGGQGKSVEGPLRDYLQIKVAGNAAARLLQGELYAEDPSNTCYLFALSVHRADAGEFGRSLTIRENDELMERLRRVFRSVSIDWTHPKR
jgi:hypothetical protein